jgi:hypothetical protein
MPCERLAETHHFYAAPASAPGKNFDAAPAPTLLCSIKLMENERKLILGLWLLCPWNFVRYRYVHDRYKYEWEKLIIVL